MSRCDSTIRNVNARRQGSSTWYLLVSPIASVILLLIWLTGRHPEKFLNLSWTTITFSLRVYYHITQPRMYLHFKFWIWSSREHLGPPVFLSLCPLGPVFDPPSSDRIFGRPANAPAILPLPSVPPRSFTPTRHVYTLLVLFAPIWVGDGGGKWCTQQRRWDRIPTSSCQPVLHRVPG
ncbi:hypothetical protein NLJ89_g12167 [Agrocybe chaxingu]|uniref:Uncharacterized protein n=1 Tax=Agrocybe chaxingu TaxID=84603 RepID=A0A9W8JMD2_9AGAR|nr:hypothetical protein NLJ89_g12167 [Agrocybe chaxingu]